MDIEKVECIWWDGYHNAFTSIIKFKGNYYCTFRHGTEHGLNGKGEIYVIKSENLKDWQPVKIFPNLKDSRDPKLFTFKGKLGILFFAYPDLTNLYRRDAYISYSEDGIKFSPVIKISKDNFCFWKIRNYNETLYATAYSAGKKESDWGSYIFISKDGKNFERFSTIVKGEYANETDLFFEKEKCYAIVRRENKQTSILGISEYSFEKWEKHNLNEIIMAPEIFKFKEEIFVVGRTFEGENPKTVIFSLNPEKKEVKKDLTLPSGGDTSYCGSVIEKERVIISYYSQHEIGKRESKVGKNASGIYLAIVK